MLLETAEKWLKEQGMQVMRGPWNLVSQDIGFIYEGFDLPTTVLSSYNPPYYNDQMVQYGMKKIRDLNVYNADLGKEYKLPGRFFSFTDKIARRYDLATSFSQGYASDLQLSVDRMQLSGNEQLADLCCGTGKSTIACLNALPKGSVLAVDFSEEMLAVARQQLSVTSPHQKLTFRNQDVMNLDLPDNSLDAIFMAYGIRNMSDYAICLKNLLRILKPGGIIAFHEYAISDSLLAKIYWYLLGYLLIIPFSAVLTGSVTIFSYLIKSVVNFLSPREFKALLRQSGFTDVRSLALKSWRRPILHTFIAVKPSTGHQ